MDLNQQLMHNLRRASASTRRHAQGQVRHRGFGHILELLSRTNGMSQQQIADALGIRPQSVSEAVNLLEERGFIRKEVSDKDRRVTLIYVTEAGQLHEQGLARERDERAQQLFSVLSTEEKETLLALLAKINQERESD